MVYEKQDWGIWFKMSETIHYQGVNDSYEFPRRAKYNPPESVILTIMDFFRGEIVEFLSFANARASGSGYAFYRSVSRPEFIRLVDIADLISIENETGYFSPEESEGYEQVLDEQYKDTGINIDDLV